MPIIVNGVLTNVASTTGTQAIDLINGALLDIGGRAAGEPAAVEDANEAFILLNQMMGQWSNESLMVVSVNEIIQTVGGGGTDWTIGNGGQINTQRPMNISSAFVRVNTLDYPVAVINVEQYELIGLKQLNGPWPKALYYNSGSPLGIIKLWPNPSAGELHLFVDQVFSSFATLNDAVQFPPGYDLAIRHSLAELLTPGYAKCSDAHAAKIAQLAARERGAIKGTNMNPTQTSQFDTALMSGRMKDAGFIMHGGMV